MSASFLRRLQRRYSKRYPHRLATCLALWTVDAAGAVLARSGVLRPRPLPRTATPAILLIRNDQIGDAIMATAVIGPLRRAYPGAKLTLLLHTAATPLFRDDDRIARIIPLRTPWFSRPRPGIIGGIRELARAFALVHTGRFDLVIDLRGDIRNIIWFGRLATRGAVVSYGDVTAGRGWVDYPVSYVDSGEIASNLRLLSALGIGTAGAATELRWSAAADQAVSGLLREAGIGDQPLVGIHPGAAWAYKRWPAERFAAVARALEREHGVRIIIDGSIDEQPLVDVICRQLQRPLFVPGRLDQLPALVKRMRLLITNDTSITHIAAAVGTETIALWGPGDLGKFGDQYPGLHVISRIEPCNPCPQRECRQPERWCLGQIPAEEVLTRATAVLGAPHGR